MISKDIFAQTANLNIICSQYETNCVACPPYLTHGIFTTATVDNIDHNPSSTTASDLLHGTVITVAQHPVESSGRITDSYLEMGTAKTMRPLPRTYVQVMPVSKNCIDSPIEKLKEPMCFDETVVSLALQKDNQWLQCVIDSLSVKCIEE